MSEKNNALIYDLAINNNEFSFTSSVRSALEATETEIADIEETIDSVKKLKPDCDKLDYVLAACSGVLCGLMDVFLLGKPGNSPLGNATDKWFEERTKDFAKLCGWNSEKNPTLSSATGYLERHFKVPYDQRGAGDAGSVIFDLNPSNHHFKSLGHNPTILGLFFSVLDQFNNESYFVSNGELISLTEADGEFHLRGNNVQSKLFCGFVNWFGHLISDMSGASGSTGRGMGIPSPLWAWVNDVIAIRRSLHIETADFDRTITNFAVQIYKDGFDARFQAAQSIPVLLNETVVRLIYSVRRLIRFFSDTSSQDRSIKDAWKACSPFSNPSVNRMLTVAHGVFCIIDIGDAGITAFVSGAGSFNAREFFLRVNLIGVGRFAFSLYGETKAGLLLHNAKFEAEYSRRKRAIIEDYIDGLKKLAVVYEDKQLTALTIDLQKSDMYLQVFEKSVRLAEQRGAPEDKILKTKSDIDSYFTKGE